jgi:hypothetical protein
MSEVFGSGLRDTVACFLGNEVCRIVVMATLASTEAVLL